MRHMGSATSLSHLLISGATFAFFVLTLAFGAVWLPARIEVYYTPTDRADVVYQLWQYLILVPIGALLLAMALATFARAIVIVFSSEGAIAETRVMAWMSAWVFASTSAVVWVAIWLGNDHPEQRSWLESGIASVAFLGALAIVVLVLARSRRRARRAHS